MKFYFFLFEILRLSNGLIDFLDNDLAQGKKFVINYVQIALLKKKQQHKYRKNAIKKTQLQKNTTTKKRNYKKMQLQKNKVFCNFVVMFSNFLFLSYYLIF